MIQTRSDLKRYLQADRAALAKGTDSRWIQSILNNDANKSYKLQTILRYTEYYRNNRNRGFFYKLMYLYYKIKGSRYGGKIDCAIAPNSCGPGLKITHPKGIMISWDAKIGKNFSVRRNSLIGNSLYDHKAPTIGDYVQFGVGAQAVGDVVIGRGAIISNGSVVLRRVPPYAIIVGNPGKIIGFTMSPEEIVEWEKDKYSEDERTPIETLQNNYKKYVSGRYKDINKFTSLK